MTKTISDEDIEKIRRVYEKLDISQAEIAKAWHTSQPHISRIVRGLRRASKIEKPTTNVQ